MGLFRAGAYLLAGCYFSAFWMGLIRCDCPEDTVKVALRPFNDKRYNQDLEALCERVNAAAPHLPDGRRLHISVQINAAGRPILDVQKRQVA